jgi:hypothetical protein
MESTWNSRGVQYRAEVAELERKLKLTEQVLYQFSSWIRIRALKRDDSLCRVRNFLRSCGTYSLLRTFTF